MNSLLVDLASHYQGISYCLEEAIFQAALAQLQEQMELASIPHEPNVLLEIASATLLQALQAGSKTAHWQPLFEYETARLILALAEDETALQSASLAMLRNERWPDLIFQLHPTVLLLTLPKQLVNWRNAMLQADALVPWQMLSNSEMDAQAVPWLLRRRQDASIALHRLDADEFLLLQHCAQAMTIGQITDALAKQTQLEASALETMLVGLLRKHIALGHFVEASLPLPAGMHYYTG